MVIVNHGFGFYKIQNNNKIIIYFVFHFELNVNK